MKIVSLILARGGSKGIPKKNIYPIAGKPLLFYSLNASQKSNVNETWVSTDCPEIKKVALAYDAKVLDRPNDISCDTSQSEEALLHFAEQIDFDIMVFIQPTSPLLLSQDINNGISLLLDKKYDSVFSVYKEHWVPRWSLSSEPINWDIAHRPRRQDVQENYVENGAFYITYRNTLLNSQLRYSGNIGCFEMPLLRSFQIDTLEDIDVINKLMI